MQQDAGGAVQEWFVYMVECADGTLYTGVTTDISRRISEHNTSHRGAKYTRSRRPVQLRFFSRCASRSDALKEEIRIKQLSRTEKIRIIKEFKTHVKDD